MDNWIQEKQSYQLKNNKASTNYFAWYIKFRLDCQPNKNDSLKDYLIIFLSKSIPLSNSQKSSRKNGAQTPWKLTNVVIKHVIIQIAAGILTTYINNNLSQNKAIEELETNQINIWVN